MKSNTIRWALALALMPVLKNAGATNAIWTCKDANINNINWPGRKYPARPRTANIPHSPSYKTAKPVNALSTDTGLLHRTRPSPAAAIPLLRLKLVIDTINYDDIAIGFSASASDKYNPNEDSKYLEGIDAPEGLSSFSSDSVRLSVNVLPLPKIKPLKIRLDVEGRLTRTYTLERTELSVVPAIYEFWLMDKFKRDSLDIRNNADYTFDLDVRDTATYGANRFSVVVRQNPALGVHLLDFSAIKASGGAEIGWQTENEENYTNFTAERSSDNGGTFEAIGGFSSTASGSYSLIDKNPPAAADRYRLKIEDLNGTITYSNIITLIYGGPGSPAANNISVYPNPAGNVINLIMLSPNLSAAGTAAQQTTGKPIGLASNQPGNTSYRINIINITGLVVKTATSAQANWQDDISNLQPGTYIIQVQNNFDKSLIGKGTFVKL